MVAMAAATVLAVIAAADGAADGTIGCWAGAFTEDLCCDSLKGPNGHSACWDGQAFTFERCCLAEVPACRQDFRRHRVLFHGASSQVERLGNFLIEEAPKWESPDCFELGGKRYAVEATEAGRTLVFLSVCVPEVCFMHQERMWVFNEIYADVLKPRKLEGKLWPGELQFKERPLRSPRKLLHDIFNELALPTLAALSLPLLATVASCCLALLGKGWQAGTIGSVSLLGSARRLAAPQLGETSMTADVVRVFLVSVVVIGHVGSFTEFRGTTCRSDPFFQQLLQLKSSAEPKPRWCCAGQLFYRWANPGFMLLSGFLLARAARRQQARHRHGGALTGAAVWLSGRIARSYFRQVPQHLARLAFCG